MGKVQKRVLRVAEYMSTFVVGIWTQLKSLEATNGILPTKMGEMPTFRNSKGLQEIYYVPSKGICYLELVSHLWRQGLLIVKKVMTVMLSSNSEQRDFVEGRL